MNPRWNLEHRVAGLLDPSRNPSSRARRWKLAAVAFTLILTSVAVAGVRWEEPQSPDKGRAAAAPADQKRQSATPNEPKSVQWPIPGIVVDEAGRPAPGATVRLVSESEPVEEATTRPDGSFVIPANEPILPKFRLIATSDEGRRQALAWFSESSNSLVPAAPARLVLKPCQVVTVHVTDRAGKPIPDAAVEVIARGASVAVGRTDAAGRAVVRYPQGLDVEWIVALKPGAGLDYYENYRSYPTKGSATVPEDVTLVLSGAETVRVKAIDPQGHPIPGVVFRLSSIKGRAKLSYASLHGSRVAWARTDREGIALFDWLPPDRHRDPSSVDLAPGAYCAPGHWILGLDGKPTETTVRVVRKTLLRGKLVNPDGGPAGGILVEARAADTDSPSYIFYAGGSVRTAADGSYQILVPPDRSYMVGVFDQNWAARSLTGVMARANEPCNVPDLHLIKGTVIRGRITIGPEGKPLAGQTILLLESGPPVPDDGSGNSRLRTVSIGRELDADREGRFSFRVGPGDYELSVRREGQYHHRSERFDQKVGSEAIIDRELQLEDPKDAGEFRMIGVVLDRTRGGSNPVADAVVELVKGSSLFGARAVT